MNATGSIKVKFNVIPSTTGFISNGSYSIEATGSSPLIGPLSRATVTNGVTYSDLEVSVSDGATAVGWGQAVQYTIQVTKNGPSGANSASITNTLPAQLTGATWACAGAGGVVCGAALVVVG